jgi:CHAD domain-containing protein
MGHRRTPAEQVVRQRVRVLTRSLAGAVDGDGDLVHQARIATRRLREVLPLVAPGARGRKLARRMRRLAKTLGPARELDVVLQTLDDPGITREIPRTAISTLKQVLDAKRERRYADMARKVSRIDVDKLRRRALAAARKGRSIRAGAAHRKRLTAARDRAARRAVRLRASMDAAAGLYLPDRLHEVRIAIKKLRYALELVHQMSGSRASARVGRLKAAQDLLGRMHDLEVLIARVRAVQASPGAPNLRLSADLDRLVRRLEMECRQLHGQYTALRKTLAATCDQTIAEAAAEEAHAPAA